MGSDNEKYDGKYNFQNPVSLSVPIRNVYVNTKYRVSFDLSIARQGPISYREDKDSSGTSWASYAALNYAKMSDASFVQSDGNNGNFINDATYHNGTWNPLVVTLPELSSGTVKDLLVVAESTSGKLYPVLHQTIEASNTEQSARTSQSEASTTLSKLIYTSATASNTYTLKYTALPNFSVTSSDASKSMYDGSYIEMDKTCFTVGEDIYIKYKFTGNEDSYAWLTIAKVNEDGTDSDSYGRWQYVYYGDNDDDLKVNTLGDGLGEEGGLGTDGSISNLPAGNYKIWLQEYNSAWSRRDEFKVVEPISIKIVDAEDLDTYKCTQDLIGTNATQSLTVSYTNPDGDLVKEVTTFTNPLSLMNANKTFKVKPGTAVAITAEYKNFRSEVKAEKADASNISFEPS